MNNNPYPAVEITVSKDSPLFEQLLAMSGATIENGIITKRSNDLRANDHVLVIGTKKGSDVNPGIAEEYKLSGEGLAMFYADGRLTLSGTFLPSTNNQDFDNSLGLPRAYT